MIRALLVYDRPGLARNQWFAKTFQEKFQRRGGRLDLTLAENLDAFQNPERLPDAVFMRCIRPDLSLFWEKQGVRVFNSAEVSRIANDKLETFRFAKGLGLPVMDSRPLDFHARLPVPLAFPFPFPFVLKTVDGHGGNEVFLIDSEATLRAIVCRVENGTPRKWLVQRLADSPGLDVRVYVVGNQIVAAMKRASTTDFRSNYSLGGSAEIYELSSEEKKLVSRITSALSLDFVGVDLIFHENRPVLNEIEDVVGSRMLYAKTNVDILERFLDYLEVELAD